MYSLITAVFIIACVLHSGQACRDCGYHYELDDAYCYPYKHAFLIQAEVVEKTGPHYTPRGLDTSAMTEEEKEQSKTEYGFMRHTMTVKEIYRDDGADIRKTVVIDAMANTTICGAQLKIDNTYVLSGYFYTLRGNMWLETDACEYIRQYDPEVEVVLPECPDIFSKRRSEPPKDMKARFMLKS